MLMKGHEKLRDKWLAALRSGEYKQAQGALRSDSGYCCLGVLCDLVDPDGWYKDEHASFGWWHRKGGKPPEGDVDGVNAGHLSGELTTALSLTLTAQFELSRQNDTGYVFEDIAQYIERHE